MKIVEKSNFRVIIEPKMPWEFIKDEEKYLLNACKEIESQVKRHVDDIGSLRVEYDTEILCSFCQQRWEVDEKHREPGCCLAAFDEWEKENPKI